jgi:hypothetical protein
MLQLPQSNVTPTRAKPETSKLPAVSVDPIFAAIRRYTVAERTACRLSDELDEKESDAGQSIGRRPTALISWRNYSAIGGSELERCRDEFLAEPGCDSEEIWREYRDAKRRCASRLREIRDWISRAGLAELVIKDERAQAERERLAKALSETSPTTIAGAAALLRFVLDEELCDDLDWHVGSIETVAAALARMKA